MNLTLGAAAGGPIPGDVGPRNAPRLCRSHTSVATHPPRCHSEPRRGEESLRRELASKLAARRQALKRLGSFGPGRAGAPMTRAVAALQRDVVGVELGGVERE